MLDVYRISKQTFEEHEKNHNLLYRKKNIYHKILDILLEADELEEASSTREKQLSSSVAAISRQNVIKMTFCIPYPHSLTMNTIM